MENDGIDYFFKNEIEKNHHGNLNLIQYIKLK